jgi:L-malate glycosyltransferase
MSNGEAANGRADASMASHGSRHVQNVLMTCSLGPGAGGVQIVFDDMARWLEQTGRRVHLIYDAPVRQLRLIERPGASSRRTFDCPMPASVSQGRLASLLALLVYAPITAVSLTRLLRRLRIDVVNCHFLAPSFIHLVMAARLTGIPIVISVHGADIDSYERASWLNRWLLRSIVSGADRVVACSAGLARQTAAVFPEHASKISWVHNALDVQRYRVSGETTRPLPQPFILCVCRHVLKKGVDTLLRAFALVQRDVPEVSLVLVGDGPLLAEHRALARTLQIDQRVVFMGDVPHAQVSSIFERCALFVLPSRSEPFGIVLLEAAWHGKPIVATRVGGVPEIITDGTDGLLIEADDPKDMARRIVMLLRDPERAARLGRAAHRTLHERFMWKDRIRDYIDIFEGAPGPALMVAAGSTSAGAFSGSFHAGSWQKSPDGKTIV